MSLSITVTSKTSYCDVESGEDSSGKRVSSIRQKIFNRNKNIISSSFACQRRIVEKRESWRNLMAQCGDCRQAKQWQAKHLSCPKAIKWERFKMPTIEEITARVAVARVLSKVDANHGYWKIHWMKSADFWPRLTHHSGVTIKKKTYWNQVLRAHGNRQSAIFSKKTGAD